MMAGIRPKQHARMGMFHLEEAILDILLEAKHEGECIGAAQIGRKAGIYRESGAAQMNDAIATGVLNKLADEGRVERCSQTHYPSRGGWELSDAEFNLRRDDVS